jgi:Fur family iron response transcriptional regulator
MISEKNTTKSALSPEQQLRGAGIYPTPQRLAIAEVLMCAHQHVTAEQLHERLLKQGKGISIATVYNTLSLLVQKELLKEVFVEGGCTYYDSNNTHHHHCYNIDTRELIDVTDGLAPQLDTTVLPAGTSIESIDIIVRVRNKSP